MFKKKALWLFIIHGFWQKGLPDRNDFLTESFISSQNLIQANYMTPQKQYCKLNHKMVLQLALQKPHTKEHNNKL